MYTDKNDTLPLMPGVNGLSHDEAERFYCFLFSECSGIGAVSMKAIKNYAGGYKAAAGLPPERLLKDGILNKSQAVGVRKGLYNEAEALSRYRKILSDGIRILCIDDAAYPERLRNIDNAPELIYVRGELPDDKKPSVSIIGARSCSDYGIAAAEYFAGELAACGVQIVSGLAYGIDAAAAEGAMRRGGKSFAVLGSGVNVCYPKENYPLYRRMTGIISEFSPSAEALSRHFVMRNRLIAGLGDVLIVIEAREKSGTSITVGYALEQGKDIFALPGRITDPLGRGCNKLLRDGAIPLTEPEDVLIYLGVSADASDSGSKGAGDNGIAAMHDMSLLTADERTVYGLLSTESMHTEEISLRTGKRLSDTELILSMLEIKGAAVQTGRAYWKRKDGIC